jgi:isocitrate/isopropylmalate dehydrogenase
VSPASWRESAAAVSARSTRPMSWSRGLWREVAQRVCDADYRDLELSFMYADNCAMQLRATPSSSTSSSPAICSATSCRIARRC